MRQKYGDIFGLWVGPIRSVVVVCDFDVIQVNKFVSHLFYSVLNRKLALTNAFKTV